MSEFFFFNFMHSRLLQLQSIKKNVKKSFERTKKKTGSTHVSYKPDTAGSATSFRHMTLTEMFLWHADMSHCADSDNLQTNSVADNIHLKIPDISYILVTTDSF